MLKKTKFIINTGENPYNIFTIDAFNNHVNIIYEKLFLKKIKFFKKNKLIFLNFNNITNNKIFFSKKKFVFKPSTATSNYSILKKENISYFKKIKINYKNQFFKI